MSDEICVFKMQLKFGVVVEYKRCYDEFWFEFVEVLCGVGIFDYFIFLDESMLSLFVVFKFKFGMFIDELLL